MRQHKVRLLVGLVGLAVVGRVVLAQYKKWLAKYEPPHKYILRDDEFALHDHYEL